MSKVIELIEVQSILMCPTCKGAGKAWTDIGFGDMPSDSRYKKCKRCNGTGRIATILAKCEIELPFNVLKYDDRGEVLLVTEEEITE